MKLVHISKFHTLSNLRNSNSFATIQSFLRYTWFEFLNQMDLIHVNSRVQNVKFFFIALIFERCKKLVRIAWIWLGRILYMHIFSIADHFSYYFNRLIFVRIPASLAFLSALLSEQLKEWISTKLLHLNQSVI